MTTFGSRIYTADELRQDNLVTELERARRTFEVRFGHVEEGLSSALTKDGYPYVTVTIGGVRTEGAYGDVLGALSPPSAVSSWLDAAHRYADSRGGSVLVWRKHPEFVLADDLLVFQRSFDSPAVSYEQRQVFQVYSRMYVSSREDQ